METKLLPCPFCGDKMTKLDGFIVHTIASLKKEKGKCPILTVSAYPEDWNRRASTDSIGADQNIRKELDTLTDVLNRLTAGQAKMPTLDECQKEVQSRIWTGDFIGTSTNITEVVYNFIRRHIL